jgi:hypothetical protein
VAGIVVTFFYLRWQLRSQEESPEAIKERVNQLAPALREHVRIRSYGARRRLIEAPLRELDLDITPRMGWVRDPRLLEPECPSEEIADNIVAAFESSRRRMLIVGEPGSGKTMAAYSLIEYLDKREGDERIPLLVNLSAWEAQDSFEAFLVDYLCSSVGYEAPEREVAEAFISSDQYALILDGLDEIPAELRTHFSERFDEFVSGLPDEDGVVVSCRTQEYEQLLAAHETGLGLVQAVEMLPLTSEQLDSAFVDLTRRDKDWELFLSQRDLTAYQRVRQLLSNPLFLNLVVVSHLSPNQLLDWTTTEEELQDLVLDSYLGRTLTDQSEYEPEDARRYLTWIARFLNGAEVSPFGLNTTDSTVFDLADLTPPEPPRRYRLFEGLVLGLVWGLTAFVWMLPIEWQFAWEAGLWGMVVYLVVLLAVGLVFGLGFGAVLALAFLLLPTGRLLRRSATSSRLTLAWPSTRRQLLAFLGRAGRGLVLGVVLATVLGAVLGLITGLAGELFPALLNALSVGLAFGLAFGLVVGLGSGLLQTRSVLITSRTPKDPRSRSLIAALTWLILGLAGGLVFGLAAKLVDPRDAWLALAPSFGLSLGLGLGLRNGGWFVLLQKAAHRRLARAENLSPRLYDFLEWGVERQIFRRVGGGVRFRHNLIQQHLAHASEGAA